MHPGTFFSVSKPNIEPVAPNYAKKMGGLPTKVDGLMEEGSRTEFLFSSLLLLFRNEVETKIFEDTPHPSLLEAATFSFFCPEAQNVIRFCFVSARSFSCLPILAVSKQ